MCESIQDFAHIFHSNHDFLRYYVLQLGAKPEACDDILLEVFMRYFRLLRMGESPPDHRRVLVAIACRLHRDHDRSHGKFLPDQPLTMRV